MTMAGRRDARRARHSRRASCAECGRNCRNCQHTPAYVPALCISCKAKDPYADNAPDPRPAACTAWNAESRSRPSYPRA